jgi:hypothetical protein
MISVNYKKRKNTQLFSQLHSIKKLQLTNIQNYNPLYDRFFSLNANNWNAINLNNVWNVSEIKDTKETGNIFQAKLRHISDDIDLVQNKKLFIKLAPLLDPFKYMVGKYNVQDEQLFNLPSFEEKHVHSKIANPNNSSYVDSFFAFLTSKTLHDCQFIHGLDFYGSFLALKNNYEVDIIDDLDYLIQSEFFVKSINKLFQVEDYSHLFSQEELNIQKPLKISNSVKSIASIKSLDGSIFEDIFEETHFTLDDVKNNGLELVDITNNNNNETLVEKLQSDSSCSSRTSYTEQEETEDILEEDEEYLEEELNEISDKEDMENMEDEEEEDDDIEDEFEEEKIMLTFPKFPVQVICMENCENTFDKLILNNDLNDDEWFSALFQIIMILLTYQKMFSFTHNDLHTNNVMYVPTTHKFLYYVYKNQTYKIPTYGRLYKLIDFGRSIYKYQGKIFCSDSFQAGNDAATQYNTEPYFNDKKPRLEPNFSFDLCRLACSIFDYVVDDFDKLKTNDCSKIAKIINEWCIDDHGINVLYKNNGVERYPDFKLYKMIARHVHSHTPENQLERPEFKKYRTNKIEKQSVIINIDKMPICV